MRLLLAALLFAQGAKDLPGPIKVPADHPRILFGSGDAGGIRDRITSEPFSSCWRAIESDSGLGSVDPRDPIPESKGLQTGCHQFGALLAACAFYATVSGDAEAAQRFNGFIGALDVTKVENRLPKGEFMPHGEFLYGLALAYDWGHPIMTPASRARLGDIVRRRAAAIFDAFLSKSTWEATAEANNHSMACMGPLGLAGLALWGEEPKAKAWVQLAAKKVAAYVEQSFDEDGAGYEGNLYAPFGLEMALPFAAAVRRLGGADLLGDSRMRQVLKWLATDYLPGFSKLNPLNDSSGNAGPANLPLWAAAHLNDGLAKWHHERGRLSSVVAASNPYRLLWNAGIVETTPPPGDLMVRRHRGRGLVNVRSGWGNDDVFASFECGARRAGCHGQADQGQFTLYAGRSEFAIDTGYSNEPKEGSANQTVGHNLVLIDGKGQGISGGGAVVEGKLTVFGSDDVLTWAVGDMSIAYNAKDYNPVSTAVRAFLWVRTMAKPYIVVIDYIAKPGKHLYESLLHTAPGNEVTWDKTTATIATGNAMLTVRHCAAGAIKTETRMMKFDKASIGEHPVLVASGEGGMWFSARVMTFDCDATAEAKVGVITIKSNRGEDEDTIVATPGGNGIKVSMTRKGKKGYDRKF